MKKLLLYLWQLPQNVLGLLVILFTGAYREGGVFFSKKYYFGVSLGKYIIFGGWYDETDIKHEQGHQKQSLYLGPLYLLIIGLPSVCGNILHRHINFNYYKQPWEAWADKLGNVPSYTRI